MSIIGVFHPHGVPGKDAILKYPTKEAIYEVLGLEGHRPHDDTIEAFVIIGSEVRKTWVGFEFNEQINCMTLKLYGGVNQPFVLVSHPSRLPLIRSFMKWRGFKFQGLKDDSVKATVQFRQKRF